MHNVQTPGAIEALPPPCHGQAAHVAGRVRVSPELAATIAGLAYGTSRRSDVAALAAVTASRCGFASTGAPL